MRDCCATGPWEGRGGSRRHSADPREVWPAWRRGPKNSSGSSSTAEMQDSVSAAQGSLQDQTRLDTQGQVEVHSPSTWA